MFLIVGLAVLAWWLSWLEHCPQTKESQVQFLVRVYAWVAVLGPGQGVYESQPIGVFISHLCFSLSLSLSLSLLPSLKSISMFSGEDKKKK